jgi:DNA-binding MarR family transcriptional regulator
MTHPFRPHRSRPLRTPAVEGIIQNLLEMESATPETLSERTQMPVGSIYQALARMGVLGLVNSEPRPLHPQSWGRTPYHYSLTGLGKNLAGSWGMTPRPRDIPIQGQTQ